MAGSTQLRAMRRGSGWFERPNGMNLGRQRIVCARPFQGSLGAKLYVGDTETTILFRNMQVTSAQLLQMHDRSTADAAVATVTSPTNELEYTLPVAKQGVNQWYQVRTHLNDYQNETIYLPRRFKTDVGGDGDPQIYGIGILDSTEKRDDGVVRLYFSYYGRRDGLQPEQFVVSKTAGTPTVADVEVPYIGDGQYWADLAGMANGDTATFQIVAENGTVSKTLVTGIVVTADAAGPPDVTNAVAVEVD